MDGQGQHPAAFEMAELLLKHLREKLSPAETGKLNAWLAEDPRNAEFLKSLTTASTMDECLGFFAATDTAAALKKVQGRIQARQSAAAAEQRAANPVNWWRATAAIFILLAATTLFWQYSKQASPAGRQNAQQLADIAPGTDKATLVLADGSTVVLDNSDLGTIREQQGIRIRQEGSQVIYETAAGAQVKGETVWNTIMTPRGGQYRIALPDGSNVWLNAASELRFPTSFNGPLRTVELKGEAYFEIARRDRHPFHVKTDGLTIEVLGTHFNVNAYENNSVIRTTLIEGKVKLHTASGKQDLSSGRQASLDRQKGNLKIQEADITQVLAWKNGLFRFTNEPIGEIMKKLSRWYDVEAVYEEHRPETNFSGIISRNVPLSQVLKMLETTGGASFRMDGKQVIVKGGNM